MNRLKLTIPLAIALFGLLLGQAAHVAAQTKGIAVVNGTWERRTEDGVALFRIVEGRLEQIANSNLQADKSFALAVPISAEGFYVLGSGSGLQHVNKYAFYLKPGDVVNVAVNDSSYTLVGNNTAENTAVEKWHNFVCPLELKSFYALNRRINSTYVDFFPLLEEKSQELKKLKFGKTNNPVFDKAFAEYRDNDFMSIAVTFIFMPHSVHPKAEDFTAYYKQLNLSELTATTSLFHYPFGSAMISHLVYLTERIAGNEKPGDYHNLLKNDTLIGEMSLQRVGALKSYRVFQDFAASESKYMLTADQKARLEEVKVKLAQDNKEGEAAIDFRYPDVKGDTIALSDLKGKVVVIDVWATWCGPCKQQIPYLKKMEEEYRGKDVEFLSVSVDVEKDHQKWVDFVTAEELKGIQLFAAGWGSDICKYYNIKGIPRFMVVGKDGSMVSIDAPRPSTDDLKKMIDVELAK